MTLNDILVSALAQLDRGHDAQTLDAWRGKLTQFANDALIDLAYAFKPVRTETADAGIGIIDTNSLSREFVKAVCVRTGDSIIGFPDAFQGEYITVDANGPVELTYQYVPKLLSSPTDVPEIPERLHGLIVTYTVARERMSGDVSTQKGSTPYMQLYEQGKRAARYGSGLPDCYSIINRW